MNCHPGRKGKLLVFEGPDGVGKSELSRTLSEHLKKEGIDCLYLTFPGKENGTLGRAVYDIHHGPESFGIRSINPTSVQLLHIAAHIDTIESQILPALRDGTWVVLDRYWWSTWVYGLADGMDESVLKTMIDVERLYWGDIKPDKVFLITKDKPFREEHSLEKWTTLKDYYTSLAEIEEVSYPVKRMINDSSIDEAIDEMLAEIGLPPTSGKALEDIRVDADDSGQLRLSLMSSAPSLPQILPRISPAQPTVVFDAYWRFAVERQEIFFRRFEGLTTPWTDDPILSHHKFTNAYRASDRTSQYLIREVIYQGDQMPEEVVFRVLLFKVFNKIGTWELLKSELGEIAYADYSFDQYDTVLMDAINDKKTIYSAAYIMPSGKGQFGHHRKHRNHLKLIENMMNDELPDKLIECRSMQEAFDLFRSYPTIGDFLAYQYVTDINYSEITDFPEMEFVIPGPGARDGISKCFNDLGGLSEAEIIRVMADRQEAEFERLGLEFRSLWGRRLQLIDCQNLFCEVGKYARLEFPEIQGRSNRTRIKQIFRPDLSRISYWYPPKWNINELIKAPENIL